MTELQCVMVCLVSTAENYSDNNVQVCYQVVGSNTVQFQSIYQTAIKN